MTAGRQSIELAGTLVGVSGSSSQRGARGHGDDAPPPFTGAYADLDRLERAILALIVSAAERHPEGPDAPATLALVVTDR